MLDLFSPTHWQQTDRLFHLHTLLGPDVLLGETIVGIESLFGLPADLSPVTRLALQPDAHWVGLADLPLVHGSPRAGYAVCITALSRDAHLDLAPLIGQPALLEWQTDASRSVRRPIHGQIMQARLLAANGGFARYQLTIEPALAMLAFRRDSWVFQSASVIDILTELLTDYQSSGQLAMHFRFDLADRAVYRANSYRIQYQESDLHFFNRLLAEEGLYYYFEHNGDAANALLGSHTLVITDQSEAGAQLGDIRFHRSDATEATDTIQHWLPEHQVTLGQLDLQSWDYATVDRRPVGATAHDAPSDIAHLLLAEDDPGQYAYLDHDEGTRYALNAIAAQDLRSQAIFAAGSVRSLAPAAHFTLTQRDINAPGTASDSLTTRVLAVCHSLRNNFDADFSRALEANGMGLQTSHPTPAPFYPQPPVGHQGAGRDAKAAEASSIPLYANVLVALADTQPYRPQAVLDPVTPRSSVLRPLSPGVQTAIVVGVDGSPTDTDRNHRVKLQFHWQRGRMSHSRLAHPNGDNAPANEAASTWVRVGTALAGDNYGSNFIPRLGQEVIVGFTHGDIDRPIVLGTVYNGAGAAEQTGNNVTAGAGTATGNAPLWFSGNGHANHLSGLVTQTLADSQSGAAMRFSQLVLDDTPQQSRLEVATTQYETRLQLGHHQHQVHNRRQGSQGHGASLSTTAFGALRATQGLMISADGKGDAAAVMEAAEPLAALAQAEDRANALAKSAQDHQAKLPGEPIATALPVATSLKHSQTVLGTTQSAALNPSASTPDSNAIRSTAGGVGTVAAWSEPALALSAPGGVMWVTPQSIQCFANHNLSHTAQDIDLGAQGNVQTITHGGTVLFTYGKTDASVTRPVSTTGIDLHAATGKTRMSADSGALAMHAQKSVTISSQTTIKADSPQKILLTAGGSAITIQGGQILLQAGGSINLKGNTKSYTGPAGVSAVVQELPKGQGYQHAKQLVVMSLEGVPLQDAAVSSFGRDDKSLLFKTQVDNSGATNLHERPGPLGYTAITGYEQWTSIFGDTEDAVEDVVDEGAPHEESSEDGREEEGGLGEMA